MNVEVKKKKNSFAAEYKFQLESVGAFGESNKKQVSL